MVELAEALMNEAFRAGVGPDPVLASKAMALSGEHGSSELLDEAESLLRRAADAGDCWAIAKLVHFFGLSRDDENRLLTGAGAFENPDALFTLGINRMGEDRETARLLMTQAADLGGSQAMLIAINLMTLEASRLSGDDWSRQLGRELLERIASKQSSEFAKFAAVDLAFILHVDDPDEARFLLARAEDAGYAGARALYGRWTDTG